MDKGDKASGGLPGGGFIVVALLTAGVVFVTNKPLESSRPPQSEQRVEHHELVQGIDARLWQDPLGAVAKERELALKKPNGAKDEAAQHSEHRFAIELARQARAAGEGGVAVLAVMVSGGPYAERVEGRLRARYAVLAGLAARGFVPLDNEHLGYFVPDPKFGLPEAVPFERFESTPNTPQDTSGPPDAVPVERAPNTGIPKREDCKRCSLLVLWLDSTDFYERPLEKLALLADRVAPGRSVPQAQPGTQAVAQPAAQPSAHGASAPVRWIVLGPSSSDGLRAMIVEADQPHFDIRLLARHGMRFFSGIATVEDHVLLDRKNDTASVRVADALLAQHVQLLRTIGSDDALARALVQELTKRGLRAQLPAWDKHDARVCDTLLDGPSDSQAATRRAPSSIAIVSEWDTLYGRSLRQAFRYGRGNTPGFCVTRWSYVRGLDGRLPGDGSAPPPDNKSKRNKADASDATASDGTYFERPEGQSQYDYLRRMAKRMQEDDAELRRRHGPQGGIRAIGVLGNDVYDKLLVLQALQPAFPHALFFTTDLDARLFHPSEQSWARNLIVASNFGLRLASPLQRGFAPFRDSYQTSAYLSTVLAMDDLQQIITGHGKDLATYQELVNQWFKVPRVFEVSRSGPFDYSPAPQPNLNQTATPTGAATTTSAIAHAAAPPACSRWTPEACTNIHPRPSLMVPAVPLAGRFLVAGALLFALWAPPVLVGRRGRRRLRRFVCRGPQSAERAQRAAGLVIGGLLLAIVPPLLLAWTWPTIAAAITADGKPLTLFDGISPWPTYVLRLMTLGLCLFFVVRAWSSLAVNVDRISREFKLGATRRHFNEMLERTRATQRGWRRLWAMFEVRYYPERPGVFGGSSGMTAGAVEFWKHYLLQSRTSARLVRTTVCVLLMVGLSIVVASALGDQPEAPRRGDLTRTMQHISTLLPGLSALFLIFFVVDATLLCVFFVRGLRLHRSNWPARTLQAFQASTGVPADYLDDWIDLVFVARRTRAIGALVYFPFIVLSLLLLARSSFFDDWYTPPSTTVLAALSFAIVLGCALALRRMAEASRMQGVERLRDAVMRARGKGDAALASQLDLLRERMEKLSEGAFAPYSRQPLLRAVLLPLLTIGGSSLFDYLTLVNL